MGRHPKPYDAKALLKSIYKPKRYTIVSSPPTREVKGVSLSDAMTIVRFQLVTGATKSIITLEP